MGSSWVGGNHDEDSDDELLDRMGEAYRQGGGNGGGKGSGNPWPCLILLGVSCLVSSAGIGGAVWLVLQLT